jgi:glycosyltransferase involved in cell wall biosynthesis
LKVKILVDAISLLSPMTGIGRYTYEVSKNIKKSAIYDVDFYYGYYSKNLLSSNDAPQYKYVKSFITKNVFIKAFFRKMLFLSSKIFAASYDIYWQPAFIPNDGIKSKKVVTSVHDFSLILHKDFHPKERIEYFEKYFFKNIVQSDLIITGSSYTKKEIIERLDFKEEDIRVIYHGIDHNLFKIYDKPKVDFQIPKKFILAVGSIEPRKNLHGLLKAYNLLDENIRNEYQLVLVGFKGWNNIEIMDLIDSHSDKIHYLGFISDQELAYIYNLASLFVFPSFYEGFGLPPLEAMACGTPVVSSNLTSMPEVCLDAAIYCNPYQEMDIKEKIEIVLSNASLQIEMVSKGIARAKDFTWEKSAYQHIEVFKRLI